MSTVCVVRCASYAQLPDALDRLLELAGGLPVAQGQSVLLKPNVVMGAAPDKAVSTHPSLVQAVAERVRLAGGDAVLGESPGGPFSSAWVGAALRKSGLDSAILAAGGRLNDDFTWSEVPFAQGVALKRVPLINVAINADVILNLCKLKTHGMMTYTGAAKNLFGLVPGTHKAQMHARFPEIDRFASHLNDVALCANATLHIMDAVLAMEGEGPSHGVPRHVGALLASDDPWALDHVALHLMGLTPDRVPTQCDAIARGLCIPEAIQLLGDNPTDMGGTFILPEAKQNAHLSGGRPLLSSLMRRATDAKPKVTQGKCIGCGLCVKACPVQAIALRGGLPRFDYKACIRCYCCQELCPQGAVVVNKSLAARLLG